RLVEDLSAVFPRDALSVEIHLVAEGTVATERAREDQELLRVLLRHEIARGSAAITVDPPGLDLRSMGERTRRVYGIAVQSADLEPTGIRPTPPAASPAGTPPVRLAILKVGGTVPEASFAREPRGRETAPPVVFLPTEG